MRSSRTPSACLSLFLALFLGVLLAADAGAQMRSVGNRAGTRIALFVDTGYVYENIDAFEADKLRGSFGLSVTWEAPIGPIVISYAFPFNDQPGDRTEDLQFSFGTTF
mgnify:CR=1 FL=1